jgi:hypothetical protein
MLNSLFPFKLTEDNITYVLEYMKNNIADYDMTNIRYEINANNDYVVKFDKYEMTLSKDLTVGETIYTINNSFNLNSSPSSSYNQPKSSASNQLESNISIDLEMYTKIIDELNNCKIELDSFLPNKSESSYFDGELLSYYNSNYKKTVATECDTIKNNNKDLTENINISVLLYVGIDSKLEKNMDEIIDLLFEGKTTIDDLINGDFINSGSNNPLATIMLESLLLMTKYDSQINVSGLFSEFSDLQNVMLANLSFLEFFYEGDLESIKGKTINELFLETFDSSYGYTASDYLSASIDTDTLMRDKDKFKDKAFKNLFLGHLVTYGFGELKIVDAVSGNDGFDAIVLEDKSNTALVYYNCTNPYEFDDLLYDLYPVMKDVGGTGVDAVSNVALSSQYNSQRAQAEEFLKTYLNKYDKVNVGGYSLGGGLAEHAYLTYYNEYKDKLNDLILYNPFSTDANSNVDEIASNNHLKLYIAQGDVVSTYSDEKLCNNAYNKYAKIIPLDYQSAIDSARQVALSDDSYLSEMVTSYYIELLKEISKLCHDNKANVDTGLTVGGGLVGLRLLGIPGLIAGLILADNHGSDGTEYLLDELDSYIESLEKGDGKINLNDVFKFLNENKTTLNKILSLFQYNMDLFNVDTILNLQKLEVLFSGVHLPYVVELSRYGSFDENGNIIESNDSNNDYKAFKEMIIEIYGEDYYQELYNTFHGDMKALLIYLNWCLNPGKVNILQLL